jgi:hypothetical protein
MLQIIETERQPVVRRFSVTIWRGLVFLALWILTTELNVRVGYCNGKEESCASPLWVGKVFKRWKSGTQFSVVGPCSTMIRDSMTARRNAIRCVVLIISVKEMCYVFKLWIGKVIKRTSLMRLNWTGKVMKRASWSELNWNVSDTCGLVMQRIVGESISRIR